MKTKFVASTLIAALLLAVGCEQSINEPVTGVQKSVVATEETIQAGKGTNNNNEPTVIANVRHSISENSFPLIHWEQDLSYNYRIVRSDADCAPLTLEGCINVKEYPNVDSPFHDSTAEPGQYYYWVIASKNTVDNLSANSSSADRVPAVSEALKIEVPYTGDLDTVIPETPGTAFPQDVVVFQKDDQAIVDWRVQQEFVVTVFGSNDANCNPHTKADCSVELTSSSLPPIELPAQVIEQFDYIWASIGTPSALNIDSNPNNKRTIGPYRLAQQSLGTEFVHLSEIASFEEHSIIARFPKNSVIFGDNAEYTFVNLVSLTPVNSDDITAALSETKNANGGLPLSKDAIYETLTQWGNVSVKNLHASNFAQVGDMLSFEVPAQADRWHTVLVIASDDINTKSYAPASIRATQHISVNVRGKYGLWQVLLNDMVVFSSRESGLFYPGPLDWKQLTLDAKLALPEKMAYYFTGCPFLGASTELGEKDKMYNNSCLFAKNVNGVMSTPFDSPTTVAVTFEPRARSQACENFITIPNDEYKRSRYSQADNASPLLCDYRGVNRTTNNTPNFYVFTSPNGDTAELARGKVEMWHAGTQAPIYMLSNALPSVPDAVVKATVCSDFTPDGEKCDWSSKITVVRCNGYYAYNLAEPSGCSMSYALEEDKIGAVHRLNSNMDQQDSSTQQ